MKHFKNFPLFLLIFALLLPLMAAPIFASENTVIVKANPDQGWTFNPDPNNATPAGFTKDKASIGIGSLHAEPITNVPNAQKFILRYVPSAALLVSGFQNFSIDFLIDDDDASKINQFYINVYTLGPVADNQSFYDCRFDFIASSGSISAWTALGFNSGTAAGNVGNQWALGTCPASLSGMPAGSTVSAISVNMGDTSGNDTGVGGYFDNAKLTVDGTTTVFDFEPYMVAQTEDDCKKDKWQSVKRLDGSSFNNQGDCVQYVKTGK